MVNRRIKASSETAGGQFGYSCSLYFLRAPRKQHQELLLKPNHRLPENSPTGLLYVPGLGAFSILRASLLLGYLLWRIGYYKLQLIHSIEIIDWAKISSKGILKYTFK